MPTDLQFELWHERGWLMAPDVLEADAARELPAWVDEVAALPSSSGCLQYREDTSTGPRLCRSERFTDVHAGLRQLLRTGPIVELAGDLLGEPAVLYKEKINYKPAGGGGYAPHQDAVAYPFVERIITCMIAVDATDAANGALEVVSGEHGALLPVDTTGCIAPDACGDLAWELVPLAAGATLWFHARAPHRSGPNSSTRSRRAIYATYNALSEGDLRAEYYRVRDAEIAADTSRERTGASRISNIGHFLGRPAP